jgi:hypothetical protein
MTVLSLHAYRMQPPVMLVWNGTCRHASGTGHTGGVRRSCQPIRHGRWLPGTRCGGRDFSAVTALQWGQLKGVLQPNVSVHAIADGDSDSGASGSGVNDNQCAICGGRGDLLCCDTCPRAFHLACCGEALL